jgi:hypothetical protein
MKKLYLILFLLLFPILANAQVISPNPAVAVFVTGAYVTWTTSVDGASPHVDYGTTTAYGSTQSTVTVVTNTGEGGVTSHHAATLTGLSAGTLYHYKVTTGATESSDFTFTTLSSPTGTVKTVKSSGGDYTSLNTCLSDASAGWTCLVYNGATTGSITGKSGSAGNYITAMAYDNVSISGFTVSGLSYTALKGFQSTGGVTFSSSPSSYIIIDNNYFNGSGIGGNSAEYNNSYVQITNNVLFESSGVAIHLSGNNILIGNNDISRQGDDCMYDGAFRNSVIRNNTCHDYSPADHGVVGDDHLDFLQDDGGSTGGITTYYVLIEGNINQRCVDSSGNCHFVIDRDPLSTPVNFIVRNNFVQSLDGGGCLFGTNENIFSNRLYNNTFALGDKSSQSFYSSYYANYTKSLNNIAYESETNGGGPWDTGTGIVNNYNVAYNIGYSGTWDARYSAEATYSTYRNQNPAFTNYPYSAVIPSDSWMVDKGSNLTIVTDGCDDSPYTTLTLDDVRWFQPGWAGANADVLKIGTTVASAVEATISSIAYSATAATSGGTITFTAPVSCTNNDKVWLYKNSSGTVVLAGTAPDIGAYEYGVTGGSTTSPSSQGVTIQSASGNKVRTGGGGVQLRLQ